MTTLIHGDCTEIADQIKDASVDFLLTDPPYNISNDGAKPVWIDKETGENKSTIHNQKFSETQKEDINKELKASERKIMIDMGQEEKSLRKSVKNRQVFKI